ncbi:MAG: sigma-70 family RNA polymerase sigma factor [Acidobacteriota bacterium]|nr:MAG: sigma-70 family RNA polymerase sigma factor [Acidobacteriota bacterium]
MLGIKWLESKEDTWRNFESEAMPFRNDLYRTAMWLTRNPAEAEDLVQETMFQALRSFHLYEMGTNCKAWLMRILYVHNVRRLRSVLKLQIVADEDDVILNNIPFEPPIPEKITDEEVLDAIWKLPEPFRNVLVLADIEELSYKEIASIMELPMGTVMSRLSRGRRMLRIELADYASKHGFGDQRRTAQK